MKDAAVHIEAYGCSASIADSEMVTGMLKQARFKLASSSYSADVNVIITCTVKEATFHRMVHRLRELTKLGKPLVVAGCMPKTEMRIIEEINPEASMLGPNCIEKVPQIVLSALRGSRTVCIEDTGLQKLLIPRVRRNLAVGIAEVANGCLGSCSFCQVRLAKGSLRSFDLRDIVRDVKAAVDEGCREIWLTSQDMGCYGLDVGVNLPRLIREVCGIKGHFHIRVGMMNPMYVRGMVDELLDSYEDDRVFKFIHLPVQSGSDRVLDLMNRGYTVEDFTHIVDAFRRRFPKITLSTDLIVGFPGEEEEDFHKTLGLVARVKPDIVNISKFSPRRGTRAAEMKQLNPQTVKTRSVTLHKLVRKTMLEQNSRWIGWSGEVLVDESVKGAVLGRNFAYKPVLINGEYALGCSLEAKVSGATSNCLRGSVLSTLR